MWWLLNIDCDKVIGKSVKAVKRRKNEAVKYEYK